MVEKGRTKAVEAGKVYESTLQAKQAAVSEDFLRKREEFAVSLRREKK